jgi:hypothetical protein
LEANSICIILWVTSLGMQSNPLKEMLVTKNIKRFLL